MNASERLAAEMDKALTGEAWLGECWQELLAGINREAALWRPLGDAHSIAEIVLHVSTWHEVVRRRLQGELPSVSAAQDWPSAVLATEQDWASACRRLLESGQQLVEVMRRFPAARLKEQRPGLDDSWYSLISGSLQHDIYHAGQVGLLKKAALTRSA